MNEDLVLAEIGVLSKSVENLQAKIENLTPANETLPVTNIEELASAIHSLREDFGSAESDFLEEINTGTEQTSGVFATAKEALNYTVGLHEELKYAVTERMEELSGEIDEVVQQAETVSNEFTEGVIDKLDRARDLFSGTLDTNTSFVTAESEKLTQGIRDFAETVTDKVDSALSDLEGVMDEISQITDLLESIKPALELMDQL